MKKRNFMTGKLLNLSLPGEKRTGSYYMAKILALLQNFHCDLLQQAYGSPNSSPVLLDLHEDRSTEEELKCTEPAT